MMLFVSRITLQPSWYWHVCKTVEDMKRLFIEIKPIEEANNKEVV